MKQTLAKKKIFLSTNKFKNIEQEKSSLIMLDKSFRCTNEILNFSLKFIEQSSQIKVLIGMAIAQKYILLIIPKSSLMKLLRK